MDETDTQRLSQGWCPKECVSYLSFFLFVPLFK